ncbi:MAG: TlpA disulfide reductase family protein [Phycisphaerae bacterium]|jgi:peroxiredoxin
MIKKLLVKKALLTILISFIVISGCKKSTPQETEEPKKAAETKTSAVSKSLGEIIARRTSWNPILENYYGKQMPDFKVTDIAGKVHNLADYKGKNVMIVMWATWCQPCLQEVPHIKAMRDIMDSNSLAILAISSEPVETVKAMAKSKDMNYTVISYQGNLPEPFGNIKGIPTTFYINRDGTLKLVTEGLSYLGEMKSIITAE